MRVQECSCGSCVQKSWPRVFVPSAWDPFLLQGGKISIEKVLAGEWGLDIGSLPERQAKEPNVIHIGR